MVNFPHGKRGDFFAIDRRAWARSCGMGTNAAVAYLVLARYSGPDQRTTKAGVHVIEKHTGISRPRAKVAVQALEKAGLVTKANGITRAIVPAHEVPGCEGYPLPKLDDPVKAAEPDWIWLPNALATGADNEVPPVELVRQSGDVMTLRLLVDLYHAQSLPSNGGIHWRSRDRVFSILPGPSWLHERRSNYQSGCAQRRGCATRASGYHGLQW